MNSMKVVLPNGKTAQANYRGEGSTSVYVRVKAKVQDFFFGGDYERLTTISGKIVPGINGRLPRFIPNENGKNNHLVAA